MKEFSVYSCDILFVALSQNLIPHFFSIYLDNDLADLRVQIRQDDGRSEKFFLFDFQIIRNVLFDDSNRDGGSLKRHFRDV